MGIVALFKRWFGKTGESGGNGQGDLKIACVECRKEFVFEAGEQKFYKMRGLTLPKRCTACRNKRKHHRR